MTQISSKYSQDLASEQSGCPSLIPTLKLHFSFVVIVKGYITHSATKIISDSTSVKGTKIRHVKFQLNFFENSMPLINYRWRGNQQKKINIFFPPPLNTLIQNSPTFIPINCDNPAQEYFFCRRTQHSDI